MFSETSTEIVRIDSPKGIGDECTGSLPSELLFRLKPTDSWVIETLVNRCKFKCETGVGGDV